MIKKYIDRMAKSSKKWNIHVVHNTHTDLGYTHRQEWVYRAHWRYLENVVDIVRENPDFRWTCETYWTVENFLEKTTEEYKEDFKKFVAAGNIEVSMNYLNTSQLMDTNVVYKKAMKAKEIAPNGSLAIFQDVNAISRDHARSLEKAGAKFVLGSVHSHHGLFSGPGKQRPFNWDLGNGQKILVWLGEHYQYGNEIFDHFEEGFKYTFKDNVDNEGLNREEQGIVRLVRYLEMLEKEGYPYESLVMQVSGRVIDNSPPNKNLINTVKKFNEIMPDNVSLQLSTAEDFFNSVLAEGKEIPTETGEWTDWWTDGTISTPESVRLHREAQRIYWMVSEWDKNRNLLDKDKMKRLEYLLGLFAEHTWGHFTSVGNPYSNENNLSLGRKKAMASNASEIAWTFVDDIKEIMGESFVHLNPTNEVVVYNPYDYELDMVTTFEISIPLRNKLIIDRYLEEVDNFELVDEEGNVYPATVTVGAGGMENLNTTGLHIILTKIKLKANETKTLIARKLENSDDSIYTSSFRKAGVENEEDIVDGVEGIARYNRNGIENKFYKIEWKNGSGIHTVLDKETGENIVDKLLLNPTYDVTIDKNIDDRSEDPAFVNIRRIMGRNRKGSSYQQSKGVLIDSVPIINNENMQLIELIYKVEGCEVFKNIIRLSNFAKEINIGVQIQKKITSQSENLYVALPFAKDRKVRVLTQNGSYYPWEEQITNSPIDYMTNTKGIVFEGKTNVAVSAPDTPLLQLGSLEFQRREIMNKNLDLSKQDPHIWLMTNYWETNFAGTLEGNYLFNFTISSSTNLESLEKWVLDKNKSFLTWPKYLK